MHRTERTYEKIFVTLIKSTPKDSIPFASTRCTNRKPACKRSSLMHAHAAKLSLPILSSWILNLQDEDYMSASYPGKPFIDDAV